MKISDFLIENNVSSNIEKEVIVSNRFKDEDGNIIPFKIRNVITQEYGDISRLVGNNRMLANSHLVAKCCLEPNFNSVELQNHYGTQDSEKLVEKILLVGEIVNLADKILMLSGYGQNFDELVEEAKKL